MAEFGNGLADESLLDSDPGHPELEDPGVGDEEPGLDEGEAAIEDPEEAEKLKELQNEVEKQMNLSPPPAGPVIMSIEEKMEADGRSIYVGNVDYGATAEELEAHFHGCGSVNRVTILCGRQENKQTGDQYDRPRVPPCTLPLTGREFLLITCALLQRLHATSGQRTGLQGPRANNIVVSGPVEADYPSPECM
ncbi:hypothetical protein CRUP_009387 [Coryphaenoides rupestris]|nr:hypothetical protein CRUP_009387 [Coryphaenoides rupestris]